MGRLYSDYIYVDKNFVPVFDKNADEDCPNYWKKFYPHDTFKAILNDLVGTLEGGVPEKRKSVWVSGDYGTGKSFAAFTLKHIIEDDEKEVGEYFAKNGISQSILKRINAVKSKGDILIVTRSGSSDVKGDNRLFSLIQSSVKSELEKRGYDTGGATLYENILEKLSDNIFNFDAAFEKNRSKFMEYQSAKEVVGTLKELGAEDGLELIQTIIDVADLSGFNFAQTAEDIKAWLREIIKINGLSAILFVWDEFSEFFINNKDTLTGFQELAQASVKADFPFYFFIITHRSHGQFVYDADRRKILEARFKMLRLEMANTTAFMLMGRAIERNEDIIDEWNNMEANLWLGVEQTVKNLFMKYISDIDKNDIRKLLPLHPFTAFLLQRVSTVISSNQRTMFRFLCGEPQNGEKIIRNFRNFIENTEYDEINLQYMTADDIWDYFFADSLNDGRTEPDERAKNAVIHFNTFYPQCTSDTEKKIFKSAMLLSALQLEKGRGITNMLRPTLANITACFAGTNLREKVRAVMQEFVKRNIFGTMSEGDDILYVTQSQNISPEKEREFTERARIEFAFEKLIANTNFDFTSGFALTGYAKARFQKFMVTHKSIRLENEKINRMPKNRIPLIFVFAKTEEDAAKNRKMIENFMLDGVRDVVIADLSDSIFTENAYEEFLKYQGRAKGLIKSNSSEAMLNAENAKQITDEFKKKCISGKISIYAPNRDTVRLTGNKNFESELYGIDKSIYSASIESISTNEKLFLEGGYTAKMPTAVIQNQLVSSNIAYLNTLREKLRQDRIWDNDSYTELFPNHAVSKLKLQTDKVIKDGFDKNGCVRVTDIWNSLKEEPYGLMPNIGSAFILAFLLREYADNGYYIKDSANNNTLLSAERLGEIISNLAKESPRSNDVSIVRMLPIHIDFCRYSAEIFKISKENQNSVADILKAIKERLSQTGFPLWAVNNFIKNTSNTDLDTAQKAAAIIELYCEFISIDRINGRDETKIAEEIAMKLRADSYVTEYVKSAVNDVNMKIGMGYYIKENFAELAKLARQVGNDENVYIRQIRDGMSGDAAWLWKNDTINDRIEDLTDEYKLIIEINRITSKKSASLKEAVIAICSKISAVKMPYEFFEYKIGEIKKLFELLLKIYDKRQIYNDDKPILLEELIIHGDGFADFYNNMPSVFEQCLRDNMNYNGTDAEDIYAKLSTDAVYRSETEFENSIRDIIAKNKKQQNYNSLQSLWYERTKTLNPKQWSELNEICILVLFGGNTAKVKNLFDIINGRDYSQVTDETVQNLKDLDLSPIENISDAKAVFKRFVGGDYTAMLDDFSELIKKINMPYYDMYANKANVDRIVKEYCGEKYRSDYCHTVEKRIDEMDINSIKMYLKELVKNEPLVGIKIMSKGV